MVNGGLEVVLPCPGGTRVWLSLDLDRRCGFRSEETSPQWLKELKSKKRQSLYDRQSLCDDNQA